MEMMMVAMMVTMRVVKLDKMTEVMLESRMVHLMEVQKAIMKVL